MMNANAFITLQKNDIRETFYSFANLQVHTENQFNIALCKSAHQHKTVQTTAALGA